MNLEIGMYVRTKRGQIGKITTIGKDNIAIEFNGMWQDVVSKTNIVKEPSFNIMDIIEEEDYVNGYYVEDVFDTFICVATGTNYFQSPTIYEQDIKSIVTKEQFEQLSYKVGD